MKGVPVDDAMTDLDTDVVEMVGIHAVNAMLFYITCKLRVKKLIK